RQKRKLARRKLDRLVRNADGTAVDVRFGKFFIGRKVKIREDRLALSHHRPFLSDGLLDLHDRLRIGPHCRCIRSDLRTNGSVILVGESAAFASSVLNQNTVSGSDKGFCAGGHKCNSILIRLYFLRNANLHFVIVVRVSVCAYQAARGPRLTTVCAFGEKKSRDTSATVSCEIP